MTQVAFIRSFSITGLRDPQDLESALVTDLTRFEDDAGISHGRLTIVHSDDAEALTCDCEVFVQSSARDFMDALYAASAVANALTETSVRFVEADESATMSSPTTKAIRTEFLEVYRGHAVPDNGKNTNTA